MSQVPGEDDRLATLLRSLPVPEPPPDFVAGARRRYARALEARARREVLAALIASALGLGAAASLVLVADPVALMAWAVVVAAEATTWMNGVEIVLSIVPPVLWAPALVVALGSVVSFVLLARRPSPLPVK